MAGEMQPPTNHAAVVHSYPCRACDSAIPTKAARASAHYTPPQTAGRTPAVAERTLDRIARAVDQAGQRTAQHYPLVRQATQPRVLERAAR